MGGETKAQKTIYQMIMAFNRLSKEARFNSDFIYEIEILESDFKEVCEKYGYETEVRGRRIFQDE